MIIIKDCSAFTEDFLLKSNACAVFAHSGLTCKDYDILLRIEAKKMKNGNWSPESNYISCAH